MTQALPVYDIIGLGASENDILVKPFAPYLHEHQKLLIPHGHSFYHIVYFTKGKGFHTIDFDQFPVEPFQIYFMVPGQVHNWNFEGGVDGFVLNFSDSFFQSFLLRPDYLEDFSFFQGIAQEAVVQVPDGIQEKLQALFEEMVRLRIAINPKNLDRLRVLALEVFFHVSDLQIRHEQGVASHHHTLLRNFRRLVEKNYTTLRLPKEYAGLLYITPNHLNALCSDLLGISAGEVIRNRVVLEAKRLLVNHKLSVSQIAYQLNFNDNSYFTKFFKKYVGITPEEFRKGMMKV